MKYVWLITLLSLFQFNLSARVATPFDSLLSAIWKYENPGGLTNEPFESMTPDELLNEIVNYSNKLDFTKISKHHAGIILRSVYQNYGVSKEFKLLFEKLYEAKINFNEIAIADNSYELIPSIYHLISTCNVELTKKLLPFIDDFSQAVYPVSEFSEKKGKGLYYFEKFTDCYQSANVDPYYRSEEQMEVYRYKRKYFRKVIKKAMNNYGKPLIKYNDVWDIADIYGHIDSALLEYYIEQGYADPSVIKNNPGKHLLNLIRDDANAYQITQFILKYDVDVKKHSKEIEKSLSLINRKYDTTNFDYVYNLTSVLFQHGLVLTGDKTPLFSFLRETVDLRTKTDKKVLRDAMRIIDLYFTQSKKLMSSQAVYNHATSLWSDYLKLYIFYKITGKVEYTVWSQSEFAKMIELGLPLEILKVLVKKGFDINHVSRNGETALFVAVENNRLDVAEYFLKNKVRVDHWNGDGENAISISKSVQMLKLFINYGYDITLEGKDEIWCIARCERLTFHVNNGYTVAHTAANAGSLEILKELERTNKKILNQKDSDGKSPLHYAVASGHYKVAKFLEKYTGLKDVDRKGRNLLFFAIQSNDLDLVKYYVKNGVSAFKPNRKGVTPYTFAHKKVGAKVEILAFLDSLYEGTASDNSGIQADDATRIFMLIAEGKVDQLEKIFVLNKRLMEVRDEFQITPLIFAVNYNNLEVVSLLINLGADLKKRDDFGMSALDHAVDLGYLEVENYLRNFIY